MTRTIRSCPRRSRNRTQWSGFIYLTVEWGSKSAQTLCWLIKTLTRKILQSKCIENGLQNGLRSTKKMRSNFFHQYNRNKSLVDPGITFFRIFIANVLAKVASCIQKSWTTARIDPKSWSTFTTQTWNMKFLALLLDQTFTKYSIANDQSKMWL